MLKQLDLGFLDPIEVVHIFSLFTFPQLADLRIRDVRDKCDLALILPLRPLNIEILRTIQQPVPAVERLELHDLALGERAPLVPLFFKAFPRVRVLSLNRCDSRFFTALGTTALGQDDDIFPVEHETCIPLPALEELFLNGAACDVLQARCGLVCNRGMVPPQPHLVDMLT